MYSTFYFVTGIVMLTVGATIPLALARLLWSVGTYYKAKAEFKSIDQFKAQKITLDEFKKVLEETIFEDDPADAE